MSDPISQTNLNLPQQLPDGSQDTVTADQIARAKAARLTEQQVVPAGVIPPQPQAFLAQGGTEPAPLPDVAGTKAPQDKAASAVVSWLTHGTFKLSNALACLAENAAQNMADMGALRSLANQNEVSHQLASADATVAQVAGERASAWTTFAGSITGAVAGMGVSYLGGRGGFAPAGEAQAGRAAAYMMVGNSIFQMSQQATTLLDTVGGGKYQADEAKIRKAYEDVMVSIYKGYEETANQAAQEAQKSLQNVWDLKRAVADSNNQALINVNGNV